MEVPSVRYKSYIYIGIAIWLKNHFHFWWVETPSYLVFLFVCELIGFKYKINNSLPHIGSFKNPEIEDFQNSTEKVENAGYQYFILFIRHSLSGAYLQDYASYGYETSWVDRSHQGGVQCTGTITLACLIFELLPFVYFHTLILSGAYLQNYTSYGYEILWVDRSYKGECNAQEP